jgi:alpha-1,2-mannosyltransferase
VDDSDERGGRVHLDGRLMAGKRVVDWVALALALVLVFWWWYLLAVQGAASDWAFDFRQFWQGASDVVNGVSPYPDAALLATASNHLDPEGIRSVFRFPYPAGAALALSPLGLLGFHAAAAVWSALLIVSLLAAVWILGVRDWRVLVVVITSAPVLTSVRLGSLTPLLILLLAIAWRWRERRWVVGGSLAFAIALKLFLWPLVVWLVATRRFAAAIITAATAAAGTLLSWAAIGFAGFSIYPHLVHRLTEIVQDRGFSLVALGVEAGLPQGVAEAIPWLAGMSLLAYVVSVARHDGGDPTAFSVAIAASIALTPIVWLHYFALLIVPLALARPRLSWAWGLMWVFWLIPAQENEGDLWRIVLAIAVAGAIVVQGARSQCRRAAV